MEEPSRKASAEAAPFGSLTLGAAVSRISAAASHERPSPRLLAAYGLMVATLLLLSILAATHDRLPGDLALTREVQSLDVPGLRSAMRFSTDMTSPVSSLATMFAVVSALLLLRQPRLAVFTAGALIAHGLGGVLKLLVDRGRPDPTLVETVRIEEDYSFPSGHVEWVVAFEGFVLFAVFQLTRNVAIRAAAAGLWAIHLALTSAGRVDQGLHWPSDILASYLVGAVALLFLIWAYRVSRRLFPGES